MFGNPLQHLAMALDGLGALMIEPKLLRIVIFRVLPLKEGTAVPEEVVLKVVLFPVTWRCVPAVVWLGLHSHIVRLCFYLRTRCVVHVLLRHRDLFV